MVKKKGPKELREARQIKRRIFLLKFGVYIALVFGVVASQAIVMADDLSTALNPVELGQVAGAAIVAGALYNKLEDDRAKIGVMPKHAFRLIRNAVYHGFFWMTIMGAWW